MLPIIFICNPIFANPRVKTHGWYKSNPMNGVKNLLDDIGFGGCLKEFLKTTFKLSTFGKRFKQLRENKKLTQKDLAEKLSVNRDALAKWETDRALPDLSLTKSITEFFGVSTDFLLGKDTHNAFEEQVAELLRNNRDLLSKEGEAFLLAMIMNYIETVGKKNN